MVGLFILKDLVVSDSLSQGCVVLIVGMALYSHAKKLAKEDEDGLGDKKS